jgi:nitrate reductase (cytochrome), electron transfer subunit
MRISPAASLSLALLLTTACAQPTKTDEAAAQPPKEPPPVVAEVKGAGPDLKSSLPASDPFGIAAPDSFAYEAPEPEESKLLPRAYKGAPPQISHETLSMLPLGNARKTNECLSCHDKPNMIGKKPEHGKYPMSRSHYLEHDGKTVLDGSRYLCDQCHVPQANVKPLVENTFKPTK